MPIQFDGFPGEPPAGGGGGGSPGGGGGFAGSGTGGVGFGMNQPQQQDSIASALRRRLMMRATPQIQRGAGGYQPFAQNPFQQPNYGAQQPVGGLQPWQGGAMQQTGGASGAAPAASYGGSLGTPLNGYAAPGGQNVNPYYKGQFNINQLAKGSLGNAADAGVFNPYGSQGLVELLRQQAMQDSIGQSHAAQTQAQLAGGNDPSLSAYAQLQSQLNGQDAMSSGLLNAQLQSAMHNQDFLHQLAMAQYGLPSKYKGNYGNQLGQILGQAGGAAIGAAFA